MCLLINLPKIYINMRDLKEKDLTGQKIGKWFVIVRTETPSHIKNRNAAYFLCKCECGLVKPVAAGHLRHGNSKSCKECAMIPYRKEKGECSFNGLYLRYKHGAVSRDLEFNLNKEEFRELTKENCHYCGQQPNNIHKGTTAYGEYKYNGVDRKDNNKNYDIKNCITCCSICNRAKSTMLYVDFKDWINNITNFNKKEI